MAHTLVRPSLILFGLLVAAACSGSSSSDSTNSEFGGTSGSSASAMGGRSGSSDTAGGGSGAPAGTVGTVTSTTGGSGTSGGGSSGSGTSSASAGGGGEGAGGDRGDFVGASGAAASGAAGTGDSLQTGSAAQSGGTGGGGAAGAGGDRGDFVGASGAAASGAAGTGDLLQTGSAAQSGGTGGGAAGAGGYGGHLAGAGGASASGAAGTGGSVQTGGAAQNGGTAGEPANSGGSSTGPLVTLVGTYTTIPNPCADDELCVPGVVAAIETASDTVILLEDGHWIMDGCEHFNGFRRGEALELVGYYATIGIEVVSMTHIIEGSGGAGGGSATGGAGGSASDPGTGGPTMVRLPEGFFIDSTEVTRGQYEAWLATTPATSTQIDECETNTTFAPECGDTSACQGDDCDRPQVCVDWCDAFQYCQAVGKRLCGALSQDPTQSEWVTACSAHARNLWVYGNDYDPQACSVPELRLDAPAPVGSMNSCQATVPGYAGVYDLIGNVYEWQNNCESSSCFLYGDSYNLIGRDDVQNRCTDYISRLRNVNRTDIGFRCCASQ